VESWYRTRRLFNPRSPQPQSITGQSKDDRAR
jgi:hypothetical protein